MNIVGMIQALVDGRTVRDRTYGFEYRLNGDILEKNYLMRMDSSKPRFLE